MYVNPTLDKIPLGVSSYMLTSVRHTTTFFNVSLNGGTVLTKIGICLSCPPVLVWVAEIVTSPLHKGIYLDLDLEGMAYSSRGSNTLEVRAAKATYYLAGVVDMENKGINHRPWAMGLHSICC
jgi:hypothetical protein